MIGLVSIQEEEETPALALCAHTEEGPCKDTVEGGHLQARKGGLTRNQSCCNLNSGCLAARAMRKYVWFKPPSLWYLVM